MGLCLTTWAPHFYFLLNDKQTTLPDGNFSDSRMMAWLIRHLGNNYLQLIDEKVALMTPNGIIRYGR